LLCCSAESPRHLQKDWRSPPCHLQDKWAWPELSHWAQHVPARCSAHVTRWIKVVGLHVWQTEWQALSSKIHLESTEVFHFGSGHSMSLPIHQSPTWKGMKPAWNIMNWGLFWGASCNDQSQASSLVRDLRSLVHYNAIIRYHHKPINHVPLWSPKSTLNPKKNSQANYECLCECNGFADCKSSWRTLYGSSRSRKYSWGVH